MIRTEYMGNLTKTKTKTINGGLVEKAVFLSLTMNNCSI